MFDYTEIPFLNQELFGALIGDWVILIGLWVVLTTVFMILRKIFAGRFVAFAQRTHNQIDDVLAILLMETRTYFLVALALLISMVIMNMPDRAIDLIWKITVVVILLQFVRWGGSLVDEWVSRYKERKLEDDAAAVTTVQAMGFLIRLALWTVVILLGLENFGVDVTALIAGLGVGGIAVALAVQNILGDLFASLSIVLDKPFVVGDFLVVGDYLGTVEHIGLKTTRIRSLSGEQIVVSNSDLLNSRIRNFKRMEERRIVFGVGVVYQTPYDTLARVPELIREVVERQPDVRFDRAHFKAFGASDLQFEIVYYMLKPDFVLYMDTQQAINLALYRRFEEEGLEFAYPTQTLFVEHSGSNGTAEPA